MRSNVCKIRSDGSGRKGVLQEIEKMAQYCDMSEKDTLHMRLLTEELMGLMYGITGNYEAEFYAEKEKGKVSLHLSTAMDMKIEEREKLQAVSFSGKNEAFRGIMGKIRCVFESYVHNCDEMGSYGVGYGMPEMGMMSAGSEYMSPYVWSLHQYRGDVEKQAAQKKAEWDELEKSIIANLADDVTVGISNKKAEVTIIMKM